MAIGYGSAAPKPGPKKREKAKRQRQEKSVEQQVRALCVLRDGHCRVANVGSMYLRLGACDGPSQWCHLWDKKRAFTRGLPPEERHSTAWTCMMCACHHGFEEMHLLKVEPIDDTKGADGVLRFRKGVVSMLSIPKGTV
jgi:hypothetical protein